MLKIALSHDLLRVFYYHQIVSQLLIEKKGDISAEEKKILVFQLNELRVSLESPWKSVSSQKFVDIYMGSLEKILDYNPELKKEFLFKLLYYNPDSWRQILKIMKEEFGLGELNLNTFLDKLPEEQLREIEKGNYLNFWDEYFWQNMPMSKMEFARLAPEMREKFIDFWRKNKSKIKRKICFSELAVLLVELMRENEGVQIFEILWNSLTAKEKPQFVEALYLRNFEFDDENWLLSQLPKEIKKELALFLEPATPFGIKPYLWWIYPRQELLEYLIKKAPNNNAICYGLFGSDGLLKFVGTKKELLDLAEIENLLHRLEKKYPGSTFVQQAKNSFNEFKRKNKK